MRKHVRLWFAAAFLCVVPSIPVLAQPTITLMVDASEVWNGRVHVFEKLRVRPGKFWFAYPKWIQGEHRPTGPLNNMVNLRVTANGKPIPWTRDNVELFAFSCDVPRGVTELDISFDDVVDWGATSGGELARIKWNRLLVYPRGVPQQRITVSASLKSPVGWQYATALPIASQEGGGVVNFQTVDLERFIDSPAIIGKHFTKIKLNESGDLVEMDIAADTEEALKYKPETLAAWKGLAVQGDRMFGAHHYRSYRFLVTLSDFCCGEGLEHHESSEDGRGVKALSDPDELISLGGLLGHEYSHSWNGKYRRPAGLVTSDLETPMDAELLWVYEGLTQYLGYVLAARSGMWSEQTFRDNLADTAAFMANQGGREWRSLADTARALRYTFPARGAWSSSRRTADYYWEGSLIWLEADTIIRQKSGGKKSLDDFLKVFHGQGASTGPRVKSYRLPDVIAALNGVTPYEWGGFFRERVYDVNPFVPLGGILNSGWRLEYSAEPNPIQTAAEKAWSHLNFESSLGFRMNAGGWVEDVKPGTPAYKAGIVPNMYLYGTDDKELKPEDVAALITASASGNAPITFVGKISGVKTAISIDYHGGMRYPHLVRDPSKPDLLSDIIKAK